MRMSAELSPRIEQNLQLAVDIGERILILVLFAGFAVRVSRSFTFEPFNILGVISEGLVVFFILIRRHTAIFTMRPLDWIIAVAGTSLPLFARAGGHPLLPSEVGATVMLGGLSLAIAAKLTLRRSFGVAAANRGVVRGGPYRWVRHPMYAGYTLVYVGFFLNNPLAWNVAMYAYAITMLVLRILAEERVLAKDPQYAAFMHQVRFRLAPGVF
jgi:protein-S-isoprenylcysteine O-methyltransferase Ste14